MDDQVFTCPDCSNEIRYNLTVKLRRLVKYSEYREGLPDTAMPKERDGRGHMSSIAQCPCCDASVQLEMELRVVRAVVCEGRAGDGLRVGSENTRRSITPEVKVELDKLRDLGVIDAFKDASLKQSPESGQTHFDRTFLQWVRAAVPFEVDEWFRREYAAEFKVNYGNVEFYVFANIVGVAVDGALKYFIPVRLMKHPPRADFAAAAKLNNIPTHGHDYLVWRRTKHGYVVGGGEFFREMRKKSAGDFARAAGNY